MEGQTDVMNYREDVQLINMHEKMSFYAWPTEWHDGQSKIYNWLSFIQVIFIKNLSRLSSIADEITPFPPKRYGRNDGLKLMKKECIVKGRNGEKSELYAPIIKV